MAGDQAHLRLAYDQPGTWSLKYNGFADELLGLGLIGRAVAAEEAAWYRGRANRSGAARHPAHLHQDRLGSCGRPAGCTSMVRCAPTLSVRPTTSPTARHRGCRSPMVRPVSGRQVGSRPAP